MNYQEVIYALWEFEKINIKASTFTKPIVCRTRKGKHNKSIVFIFIESMDIDAFAATNAERADLIENCITYKASPDKAFSFNQFTKEFKIIKND